MPQRELRELGADVHVTTRREDDAADDLALLHHGMAFGHARERQHARR